MPKSRRFTINLTSALTFALSALLFGTVTIACFLAYMATSVWVTPFFDMIGTESK